MLNIKRTVLKKFNSLFICVLVITASVLVIFNTIPTQPVIQEFEEFFTVKNSRYEILWGVILFFRKETT